jgi:hypothetical protein
MTMATKKPKPTPIAPVSFEELARKRLVDTIEEYRAAVARSAGGEQLTEEELTRVLELLDTLRLPTIAWVRDVQAFRDHAAARKAEAAALERKPGHEQRLQKILAEIKEAEQKLATLRAERLHLAETEPALRVQYARQAIELEAGHPHVLAPIDQAIELRLQAMGKQSKTSGTGWSTT